MLPTNPLLNATAPAGPHLPTATLRQYAAGTLAPAAQHRVEAHTLACPRCADALAGFLQTTPATTDQALAQLQHRLRRRVQQQAPQALPATRTRHRHRLMALQLAAAATLLFGLVAGGWWTWQQRHAAPAAAPVATLETPPRAVDAALAAAPALAVTKPSRAASPASPVARPVARRPFAARARPTRRALAKLRSEEVTVARQPTTAELLNNVVLEQVARQPAIPATLPAAPAASIAADSAAASEHLSEVVVLARAKRSVEAAALVRTDAMPAAPAIPPAPVGGYGTWREKLRREAAEFKPELPEQPLSGTVQLRLLISANGKIQEIRVLHGLRADYDEEAQRLVCDGANWVPGIGGGKRAAQPVDVAVPFQ